MSTETSCGKTLMIGSHPFLTSTKKSKFFDHPPPLSTNVHLKEPPLPETDCGRPNFDPLSLPAFDEQTQIRPGRNLPK